MPRNSRNNRPSNRAARLEAALIEAGVNWIPASQKSEIEAGYNSLPTEPFGEIAPVWAGAECAHQNEIGFCPACTAEEKLLALEAAAAVELPAQPFGDTTSPLTWYAELEADLERSMREYLAEAFDCASAWMPEEMELIAPPF